MLHLCYRANCIKNVVSFIRDPSSKNAVYDFNNNFVRDNFLSKYKLPMYIEVFYPETGNPEKMKCFRRFESNMQFEFRLTGVRASESIMRKKSLWYNGLFTNKTLRPIIKWTTQEIFSYLAKYNLPLHPAYGMLGNGRYNRFLLRVDGAIGAEGGLSYGRLEWEREYYQDVLNRLACKKLI
jgi:hypothetical protein